MKPHRLSPSSIAILLLSLLLDAVRAQRACQSHVNCVDLAGDCCPTAQGLMLGCCSPITASPSTPLPPAAPSSPASPPEAPTHDYIIIGGGVAGCLIADRLIAGSSSTVLLLESGKAGQHVNGARTPAPFDEMSAQEASLELTRFDVPGNYGELAWNSEFVEYRQPDTALGLGWQANVLGGGGLTNGALTMRPPRRDLEHLPSGWRTALEEQFATLESELHVTSTPSSDGLQHGNATRLLLCLLYTSPSPRDS